MNIQSRMLTEMGIRPIWRLRGGEQADGEVPADEPSVSEPVHQVAQVAQTERPASGGPERLRVVLQSVVPQITSAAEPEAPGVPVASPSPVAGLGWDELHEAIRACQACGLCKRRKQTVPGVGDREADWMFVGEGPGAEEDERGEPFVGQAGKLLDAMLDSINLKRGQNVYISNSVKCRPPGNRTPETPEIEACRPFLERQIELVKPKLLIALGRPAAQTLLQHEVRIGQARGHLYSYLGIPVVVTYHPAYLLRNLEDKARAWEDLCFMRKQSELW